MTTASSHLRYLRYVLLHKWYVLKAGIVINGWSIPWLWRLLVHDLSKFSRAEWTPYVRQFYGMKPDVQARSEIDWHLAKYHAPVKTGDTREQAIAELAAEITRDRQRAFNAAWLHHIHHNPHHWQHWILRQDDGREVVLVPPNAVVNEMIADWIGAGRKILDRPSMATCIGETIVWYAHVASARMTLRKDVREHVEATLMALAERYELTALSRVVQRSADARATITV